MTDISVLPARIDEHIKNVAAALLKARGHTLSDALRMMMTRIARGKTLPFERLVPTEEPVATMRATRSGKLPRFTDVDALIKALEPGD